MTWTHAMLWKLNLGDLRKIAGASQISSVGDKKTLVDCILRQAPQMGSVVRFKDKEYPECGACECGDEVNTTVTGPGGTLDLCDDHSGMLTEALDALGIAWT